MRIREYINKLLGKENKAEMLYNSLDEVTSTDHLVEYEVLGEGMTVMRETLMDCRMPRFLMDDKAQRAYEFIDGLGEYLTISADDVDWVTIEGISEQVKKSILRFSFRYPPIICRFRNGVAEISWQLNAEKSMYGFIDRRGRVLSKIRSVNSNEDLLEMRKEAEEKVNRKQQKDEL